MHKAMIRCAGRAIERSQFEANVARVAGALQVAGVGAGDRVALLLRNSIAFIEITNGAGRLGAFAVPINWHFTRDEIDLLLDDCQPHLIFVDKDLLPRLSAGWAAKIAVIVVTEDADGQSETALPLYGRWRDEASPQTGSPVVSPGSIVYTSGTTGQSKGVQRQPPTAEQKTRMAALRSDLYRITATSRALVPSPLYHSFPNQFATHAAAVAEHLEIMPRFDPEDMLRIIERERITTVALAPIMFVRLLRLPATVRSSYDLSSLQWALHAGGPCAEDVKKEMIAWWGPIIGEYYGGTETGPLTLCTSAEWLARPGTCGRPLPDVELRIVDAERNDVPCGQAGEIFARLWSYPDFTFRNDPAKREQVALGDLVSLGDIGFQDSDGYLHLCDRARDMIVSGGVNIYPAEIEKVLISLDGVEDCAVFGVPDREFGEAVIGFACGPAIDGTSLRATLRTRIAGYKVPREIIIVPTLGRDPSGKLRKAALREHYLATDEQSRDRSPARNTPTASPAPARPEKAHYRKSIS